MIGGVKSKTPSEEGKQEKEQLRLLAVGKSSVNLLSARFKKKISISARAQRGFCREVSETAGHPFLWTLVYFQKSDLELNLECLAIQGGAIDEWTILF